MKKLIVILMVVAAASSPVLGAISLYLDGSPAPDRAEFFPFDPLPTLGVYSDYGSSIPWSGYILSSAYSLTNPQVDPLYQSLSSTITPYNSPYGFQMSVPLPLPPAVAFTMDMNQGDDFSTLITLWDDSSVFQVPVDTLSIPQDGGKAGLSYSIANADAGEPYSLTPGQTVAFDATDSTISFWPELYDPWVETVEEAWDAGILAYWSINETDIAFGLTPEISYETLVNGLQLEPGIYDLTLDLSLLEYGHDTAITTIEIVPEPATFSLLVLGGLMLRRKRKA